jgi:hypothetical protein
LWSGVKATFSSAKLPCRLHQQIPWRWLMWQVCDECGGCSVRCLAEARAWHHAHDNAGYMGGVGGAKRQRCSPCQPVPARASYTRLMGTKRCALT